MRGHTSDYKVNIYGDGSFTSPTVWWAALGGFGIWVPNWRVEPQPPHLPQLEQSNSSSRSLEEMAEQQHLQQEPGSQQRLKDDTSYYGAALGQTGTSTRQELTALLRALAIPCKRVYATDSASMMSKALKLIEASEKVIREKLTGTDRKRGNPFC